MPVLGLWARSLGVHPGFRIRLKVQASWRVGFAFWGFWGLRFRVQGFFFERLFPSAEIERVQGLGFKGLGCGVGDLVSK